MQAACPPSALQVATYAVTLLENDPLFNAGKGAVFTRDGIQQLEASVMVSRGHAKRAAGALGLQHVKNPSKHRQDTMIGNPGWSTSCYSVISALVLPASTPRTLDTFKPAYKTTFSVLSCLTIDSAQYCSPERF